jgi:HAD superfamily hydrolase (TIGR01509 family)
MKINLPPVAQASRLRPFRAIVFDMDGVLVDSEPLHDQAWNNLFAELNLAHHHGIIFTDYVGRSDRVLLRDLIARHQLPHDVDELIQRKLHHLLQLLRQHQIEFRDLRDLLPSLAQRYRLAIATSAPHIAVDVVMEVTGLRPLFQAIVGREDVTHAKPDPEVYATAAARLGVAPAECWAIEDTPVGIESAKAAGLTVIGLTTSLPADKLHRADHIVPNHAALRPLLLP